MGYQYVRSYAQYSVVCIHSSATLTLKRLEITFFFCCLFVEMELCEACQPLSQGKWDGEATSLLKMLH